MIGILLVASVASLGVMRRQGILARDAFTPPQREPERLGWGFWALGALLIYLVMPLGAQLALAASGDLPALDPGAMTLRANGVMVVGMSIAGVAAAGVLITTLLRRIPALGFKFRMADPLWGLAAFIAALPVILLVSQASTMLDAWITGAVPDDLAHDTLRLMTGAEGSAWWWVTTMGVVVGAPLAEELLYRGFVQSSLVALTRSRWAAIVATSVVFSLAHIGPADWRALPGLFALSVALGVAFERRARIGVPITMHALFNVFNILISS
ncbi:MAG: CPBP family intramembrane metalloprotease [Phycisphaeraceae bacterium]|nr:CPBP family intramembrane metalloprotease [Phycisphaeraceae bacterium]